MKVCDCPSEQLLRDYLAGRLDGATHEVIDGHLDACAACQSTADGLESQVDSSFPGLKPAAPPSEAPDEAALCPLMDRVKALAAGPPPANGESAPAEGTVLGNYVLLGPIGGGGMGRVFRARHRVMKRVVAVKVLSPDLFRSAGARARFRREVEAAARLTHPNVVAAYDAGEADGRDFLVMEYVEGQNLAELVKRDGPLPVGRALAFVAQAARGLAYAHAAGVVHRDVKPANLLVDAGGTVKVLDMGLARLPLSVDGAAEPGLTSTGVVMGTAAFMAPEQAADTRRADERSDVYGLGCCLCFLLTGRPPYEGDTPMAVLFAHRERPIPSLRRVRPECPAALDALFRAMVARRPEDRPATMTAVLARLEALPQVRPAPCARRAASWLVGGGALAVAASLAALAWLHPPTATRPAPAPQPRGQEPPAAVVPVEPPPTVRPKAPSVPFVHVPAGDFWRGSPDSDPDAQADEKPRKRITISHPFLLAEHKVTQALFRDVMGTNPSVFRDGGREGEKLRGVDTSDFPVDSVRWTEAVRFCNKLNERDALPPYYQIDGDKVSALGGDGWRLPTEAEWEYAARARTDTRWSFGDDAARLGDYAWFAGNSGDVTHSVGKKKSNPWGLYDIYGDVPEWCWDRYDPHAYERDHDSDPVGTGATEVRVFRGGGWNDDPAQTRSAARHPLAAAYGAVLTHVGFRVARNAAP